MIYIPWIVMALVWAIGAVRVKITTRRESVAERILQVGGGMLAFVLIFRARPPAEFQTREAFGLALTALGIAFAIWARVLLGTNWSGFVTLKEGHELIRRGPYTIVRHPIYSGLLLGLLGTAVWFGQLHCYAGVAIAFFAWWRKSRIEEAFLVDFFGDQYRRYQREVRALIPGLL